MLFLLVFAVIFAFAAVWLVRNGLPRLSGRYGKHVPGLVKAVLLFVPVLLSGTLRMWAVPVLALAGCVIGMLAGRRGDGGRQEERASAFPQRQGMTVVEAARILGVAPDAGAPAIRSAHRRLIGKNHPDRGGNDYLATQINAARDVLLKDCKKGA